MWWPATSCILSIPQAHLIHLQRALSHTFRRFGSVNLTKRPGLGLFGRQCLSECGAMTASVTCAYLFINFARVCVCDRERRVHRKKLSASVCEERRGLEGDGSQRRTRGPWAPASASQPQSRKPSPSLSTKDNNVQTQATLTDEGHNSKFMSNVAR